MTSVGYATLDVIPSFKNLGRDLDRGISGPMRTAALTGGTQFGDVAGKSAGSRFGNLFSKAAKASLVGVAGAGALAFKFGSDAVSEASDLGESINALNVSYGKSAKGVKRLGREAADSLGLSNNAFNDIAVQFSGFSKTIAGGGGKKVIGVLDDLSTRGADFASVMNLEVSDALGLFQSGLAGETEPLRRFGIDLSAASVQAFAYKEGIAKAGEELTEQQKVQARYALLMKETSKTQGDFANTSDSLANRQRKLTARWDNAQAKLGKGLLPVVEDFTGFLLEDGVPAVEKFGDWFTKDGIPAVKDFGGFVRDDLAPPLKDAAGFAGDLVGVLKDLPSPAKYAGLAALLTGGAALKLRGGGGGALGTAGKAFGLAKPVPVFVTNKGFGSGGTTVVPDGDGGGKGGKAATIGRGAAKLLPPVLIIGGLAYAVNETIVKPAKRTATPLEPTRQGFEFTLSSIEGVENKAKGFGATLDLIGAKKVEPKFAVPGLAKGREGLAEFIRLQIDAGKPVTPYIHTTPIERAIGQMKTLNAEIARYTDPTRGIDNGVPTLRGGGASTGDRAGVTINIDKVEAQDVNHLLGDLQKRSQRRGHGGFGR
jgi:hypothetical protein